MAGWMLPALKAILPHVGTIVQAAKPVFTRKSGSDVASPEERANEMQAAITQNAEHIHALAQQLQNTVTVLEAEAEATRVKLKRLYAGCVVSIVLSLTATGFALVGWLSR